jgi:hypothetical protein
LLLLHGGVQPIQIRELRDVTLNAQRFAAEGAHVFITGRRQASSMPP